MGLIKESSGPSTAGLLCTLVYLLGIITDSPQHAAASWRQNPTSSNLRCFGVFVPGLPLLGLSSQCGCVCCSSFWQSRPISLFSLGVGAPLYLTCQSNRRGRTPGSGELAVDDSKTTTGKKQWWRVKAENSCSESAEMRFSYNTIGAMDCSTILYILYSTAVCISRKPIPYQGFMRAVSLHT